MKKRSALKDASLQRILKSGADRLREEGLSGAVISAVMKDAGLTHGAFYSHFNNKDDLLTASLRQALVDNRPRWICDEKKESWPGRLKRLAQRYLTPAHRDDLSNSCALAALASETARSNPEFRRAYEVELHKTIDAICGDKPCDAGLDPDRFEEAVMFMALCIGGISLSRAVKAKDFSDQILSICHSAAGRIATRKKRPAEITSKGPPDAEDHMEKTLVLDQYPIRTYEKLRYADTDRQGHVNNAVFSTMLETGRVEILYDPKTPLASPDCAFVIANQRLSFHAEINWPGRVDIGTRVLKIGRSSITLEQTLFQNERMSASAKTVIVQMNETTRRPEPLNDAAIDHLNGLVSPKST